MGRLVDWPTRLNDHIEEWRHKKFVGARLPEIEPYKAQRGDVALIDTPLGDALSLVIGDKVAAMGKDGLIFLPLSAAKQAWKV